MRPEVAAALRWAKAPLVRLVDERATAAAAARLGAALAVGDLVILSGPLGAGKTAFVRHLARALGVPAELPVTSPTFALVQDYPEAAPPLVHADLYRLLPETGPADAEALQELGLLEARQHAALLVEWGEPFEQALGGATLHLAIAFPPRDAACGEDARELHAGGAGERGALLTATVAGLART